MDKNKNSIIHCSDCRFATENYQNKIYCLYMHLPFDKTFGCIEAEPKQQENDNKEN